MEIRDDLKFSKEHEWILEDGGNTITVGITDYAQDKLGDVVFVELPEVGTLVDAGEAVGSIESVKAVSELFSPVAGEIVEINKDLEDEPELVNTSPYDNAWMMKIKIDRAELRTNGLMDSDDYEEFTAE